MTMYKFWIWLKSALFYRCPKCGGYTNDLGYGEYCKETKNCGWIIGDG